MFANGLNNAARRVPVWAMYAAGLLPLIWLIWLSFSGGLGADPVRILERSLGIWALRFLILVLCVSPLRRFAGINLLRYRRSLGVVTFIYAALHLTVWVTLDLAFRWGEIGEALVKRPFIIVGMIAFLVMLPLAVTSNNMSVRRLGAVLWQRLHKLTYAAAALGALHFILLNKVWTGELVIYTTIITLVLALRVVPKQRRRAQQA
jgi:methionine sulfoxide reductase heme-binding subunit